MRVQISVESSQWSAHELIDSGRGLKLERFGDHLVVRREPKAWWEPALPVAEWQKAVAGFEGEGRAAAWKFWRPCAHEWLMRRGDLTFQAKFTEGSKHVGIFPEQDPHWRFIETEGRRLCSGIRAPRLLNLFGYTGAATLVAAKAGFHVTHVDASKPAVAWGRKNQSLSGLDEAPIRWILDDAVKYVRREIQRGSRYEAILLDPPSFGRGPAGEVWKAEESLGELLDLCRQALSDTPRFVILTIYSLEASSIMAGNLLDDMMRAHKGAVSIGELALPHKSCAKLLPLSLYARWAYAGA